MEPWLTGSITGVHPIAAALRYSFEHAKQDLARWTEGLTTEQLWRQSGEVGSVGFHILHIGGSVDRLMTYAAGGELSETQMVELKAEKQPEAVSREELLGKLEDRLNAAGKTVNTLDLADLSAIRYIGRKRVPVPLGVLLVHIAEHTQRHVGAAIVTTKMVKTKTVREA